MASVHCRDRGECSIDGYLMRRKADAAPIGEILELGRDRRSRAQATCKIWCPSLTNDRKFVALSGRLIR
jgi:hypothetical protein